MLIHTFVWINRDGENVDVSVSGNVTLYARRYGVDEMQSSIPLDADEREQAADALIDHARSYYSIPDEYKPDPL